MDGPVFARTASSFSECSDPSTDEASRTACLSHCIAHCTEELRCSKIGWARDGGPTSLPSPRPRLAGHSFGWRLPRRPSCGPIAMLTWERGLDLALGDPMICLARPEAPPNDPTGPPEGDP